MTTPSSWRSEMQRISAERSAAFAAAERRFERTVESASWERSQADSSPHAGRPAVEHPPVAPEEPSSYLMAAHLDRRTRPVWSQENEDPDPPRTTWLQ